MTHEREIERWERVSKALNRLSDHFKNNPIWEARKEEEMRRAEEREIETAQKEWRGQHYFGSTMLARIDCAGLRAGFGIARGLRALRLWYIRRKW